MNILSNIIEKSITAITDNSDNTKEENNLATRIEVNGSNYNDLPESDTPKYLIKPIQQDHVFQANQIKNPDINVINATSKNTRLNIMIIGAALCLMFCLLILTSYKDKLPGEVVGIVSTISGIFGACLKDAYCFEFGSSRGSKDKDLILNKMDNKH